MKTKQIQKVVSIMMVIMILSGCSNTTKKEEVKTGDISSTCIADLSGADTQLKYDGKDGILTTITNVSDMSSETFLNMYAEIYSTKTVAETVLAMQDSIKDTKYITLTINIDEDNLHIEQVTNIDQMSKEEFQSSQFISLGNYQEIDFNQVVAEAKSIGFVCE
jgi:outer membrane murein-binding lipoprotein Lpp